MSDLRSTVEIMAKHLPPGAAELRLIDVGGLAGGILRELRSDVQSVSVDIDPTAWTIPPDSVDAVVAYDRRELNNTFLSNTLAALRPGGRMIVVNLAGKVDEAVGRLLESAGFVRILIEALGEHGVLIRGEVPHQTQNTHERISRTANLDANTLDLGTFKGRYVHLLIQQTPNKPVWKLAPDERIHWRAAAVEQQDHPALLAFSSLPKAVSFMQPAVVQGIVRDVNKVGKFSTETASEWNQPVLLNPTLASVQGQSIVYCDVDPYSAEAPDE